MRLALLTGFFALALATPAHAQEEEALCPDRPGIASGPCTVEPGRVHLELQIDWSFQDDGEERVDTLLAGDALVRLGLDERTELQLGWTPYGHVRTRNASGVERSDGAGDVSVGLRRRMYEQGSYAAGLQATVTLPVGGSAIGAGDWGAELLVPMSLDAGRVELLITPSIAAAVDEDGSGRHLAYGIAVGAGFSPFLSERLTAVLDLALYRDEDPAGHSTEALLGLALAWQLNPNLQLDAGAIIGLNADSPDLEIYVGGAKRF
jgi:hypothetical protein